MPSDPKVSDEILRQLGGPRFLAMTGAKNLVYDDLSLTMQVAGRSRKGAVVSHVKITLVKRTDEYTVETFRYNKAGLCLHSRGAVTGVQCDDLQRVFTELTQLRTSL